MEELDKRGRKKGWNRESRKIAVGEKGNGKEGGIKGTLAWGKEEEGERKEGPRGTMRKRERGRERRRGGRTY